MNKEVNINLGSGRLIIKGYINIDKTQIIDGRGNKTVDILLDIEKEKLPFEDNSVDRIKVDNVLEHVDELEFVLNECHRVLKKDGVITGIVPKAGTELDFSDPTHKRHFTRRTFSYFTGESLSHKDKPAHPKYADYGFKPWIQNDLQIQENDLIHFIMSPRK